MKKFYLRNGNKRSLFKDTANKKGGERINEILHNFGSFLRPQLPYRFYSVRPANHKMIIKQGAKSYIQCKEKNDRNNSYL